MAFAGRETGESEKSSRISFSEEDAHECLRPAASGPNAPNRGTDVFGTLYLGSPLIEVAGAVVIATVDVPAGEDDWTKPLTEEHPRPWCWSTAPSATAATPGPRPAPAAAAGTTFFRLDYGQYGNPLIFG
ncbi:hypothetical protein SFUMM280S_11320 [Streptomyces fumanus]